MQTAFLLCAAALAAASEVELNRPVPALQVGRRFRAALEEPVSAAWAHVPVRAILKKVSAERQVSILLDRRIDPTRELSIDVTALPLREALAEIAAGAAGQASVLENTVYLGPPQGCAKLRTLIALRTEELFADDSAGRRQFELARRHTLHWSDLDRPADLIERIASRYALEVQDQDLVPHDLWAGATLADASAIEALQLVLIQFDLTFEWMDAARGIRIVPAPEEVRMARSYTPRTNDLRQLAAAWSDALPGVQTEVAQREVIVRGTVEQHEAIAELLNPARQRKPPATTADPVPLGRREFTLRIENVPASALMEKLEQSGIEFKYDAQALAEAGIDLDRPISLDIAKADAKTFFRAVFTPLGLEAVLGELSVELKPEGR